MKIKSHETTFNLEEIWKITLSFFTEILNSKSGELTVPFTKPMLFTFYEDYISYPIDDLKDNENKNRVDFYELILIMSWALYREWVKKVVDENLQLNCFTEIAKDNVINLFLDNLDCEEGRPLLKKIRENK